MQENKIMQEWTTYIYGFISSFILLLVGIDLKCHMDIPKKYVLKEDFIRVMQENRDDHKQIFDKCDNILREVSAKEGRRDTQ